MIPGAEGAEPADTPEEILGRQTEVLFDLRGHSALYAHFIGKDERENLALLAASRSEDGRPVIEAQIVKERFAIETELEDNVLEVISLALVDDLESPLAALYREINGVDTLSWIKASWVVCVPLGSGFMLRVSPPIKPPESIGRLPEELSVREATALRLVLGSFADRHSNQKPRP